MDLVDGQHLALQLRTAEARNIELAQQVKTLSQRLDEAVQDATTTQLHNTELKTLMSQLEVKDADMVNHLDGLEMTAENQEQQAQIMIKKMDEMKKVNEELQLRISDLTELLANRDKDIKDLTEKKLEEEQNLQFFKSQLEEVSREKKTLENQSQETSEKLSSSEKQVGSLQKQIEQLEKDQAKLLEERNMFKGDAEGWIKEADKWKAQFVELEGSIGQSVDKKVVSLQSVIQEERSARQVLEANLEHLRKQHQENEANLQEMQVNKDANDLKHEAELEHYGQIR